MKTIDQVVNGMDLERLKKIAKRELSRRANEDIRETITSTNRAVEKAGPAAAAMWEQLYSIQKEDLITEDLWNPAYDAHFEAAKKGQLQTDKLYGVKVE